MNDTSISAVRTTGIFCRPGCPARPLPQNVDRYETTRDALFAGYRPCLRCRPMEPLPASAVATAGASKPDASAPGVAAPGVAAPGVAAPGATAPEWLRPLLTDVEARLHTEPDRRWRDRDLRARDLDPAAVRRWFQRHHGLTFQAYARARNLGASLGPSRTRSAEPRGAEPRRVELRGAEPRSDRNRAEERRHANRSLVTTRFPTPLGPMVAAAVDEGIAVLEFADRRMLPGELARAARRLHATPTPGRHRHLDTLQAHLADYFAGNRTTFDLPLVPQGTPFEASVWAWLQTIPAGETRTYAEGAAVVGRPQAVRAIGQANGRNPVAIVVPCHRVIGSDGDLTGYGGGLWRKRALLDLEAGV